MEDKGFSISGNSIQAKTSFKSDDKVRPVNTPPETWSTDEQENFRPVPTDAADRKPVRMQRAATWTLDVENSYRYQLAGFRDEVEYLSMFPVPERWEAGMVKCLRAKKTGYYMYFRQTRECEDKHLNKVKVYEY